MKAVGSLIKKFKNLVLPAGPKYRKLHFGMMAGNVMKIDFHHNFRQYLGIYEIELNKFFREYVKSGYKCFDVGGKGGYDALLIAKLAGENGEVVSFDCEDEALEEMRECFSLNSYNITAYKAFVSNKDEGDFHTLDKVAEEHFVPDFMKIDIEGAELEALQGAANILKRKNAFHHY